MKEKITCKIVQDLLPNYIEGLTNEETNKYIEEHLKECEACKTISENMKKELEISTKEREKREVNYIKKFNKRMSILKKALLLIILLIVIVIGRRSIIVIDLYYKAKNVQDTGNGYYEKIQSYANGTMQTVEAYMVGEDYLVTVKRYSEDTGKVSSTFFKKGEEELLLIENGDEKVITKSGGVHLQLITAASSDSFLENVAVVLSSSIHRVNLNGTQCYLLKAGEQEKFIDAKTGLVIKIIDNANNRTVDYEYEFGTIEEEDIVKPDITGYVVEE